MTLDKITNSSTFLESLQEILHRGPLSKARQTCLVLDFALVGEGENGRPADDSGGKRREGVVVSHDVYLLTNLESLGVLPNDGDSQQRAGDANHNDRPDPH